ncbi:MAG: protein kinase [Planctomycetaceae bacterium]
MKNGRNRDDSDETPRAPVFGTLAPSFGNSADDSGAKPPSAEQGAGGTLVPERIVAGPETVADAGGSAFGTRFASPFTAPGDSLDALPVFEDQGTIFKTHRAEQTPISTIAQLHRETPDNPQFDTGSGKTLVTVKDPVVRTQRSNAAVPKAKAGKSTWNLRIHQRGVSGEISGVINEIPKDRANVTGLQSALTWDRDSPEYEILNRLGAGNMGVVYRARQTSLNRDLAVKTLKPDSPHVDHDQAMFVSEAVVTANLVHPNIVPIHDLGCTGDGKLFYSMKQVQGTAWNKTIRERSLEENLEIFMKLCDAVAYAHSRGVINRDLKPENVVVGDYGEVIVLDWGLAITTDAFPRKDSVVVDFRGGAGTPVYMAPELADDDISVIGPHSDIYVLGAILFEVVEGFPPHLLREFWSMTDAAEQLSAVIWAVVNNKIEKRISNPGELMNIALRAMSTSPADRFATVEEFQEAIREYRITGRAEELMHSAEENPANAGYSEYQHAVALYDEALRKWPNNRRAQDGDIRARRAYAALAHKKGDIDLGLQIVGENGDSRFDDLRSRLRKTRRFRTLVKTTWAVLFVAAIAGVFVSTQQMLVAQEATSNLQKANEELIAKDERLKDADNAMAVAEEKKKAAEELAQAAENRKLEVERELAEKVKAANEAVARAATAEEAKEAAVALADAAKAQQQESEARRREAEAEKKKAEDAVKPLLEQAESLRKEVAEADEKRQNAEKLAAQANWDALNKTVKTSRDLGLFGEAIQAIDEALEDKSHSEERRRFLKRWRDQIEQDKQQTAQATNVQKVRFSTVSASGRVTALATTTTVTILRTGSEDSGSETRPAEITAGDRIGAIALTADGTKLAIGGRNRLNELWDLSTDQPRRIALPESPTGANITYAHALFSASGQRLYFVGDDPEATIRILNVDGPQPEQVFAGPLAGNGNGRTNFSVKSVVLMSDESALIANTATEGIFSVPLDFDANPPILVRAGSAPGLEGLRGNESTPQAMFLSPDSSLLALALIGPNRLMILPRREGAEANKFPFVAPHELDNRDAAVLEFGPFEVSSAAFSRDNQRLVTGFTRNYIQVRDLQNGRFVPSEVPGLWNIAGKYGSLLAGHSGAVRYVSFAGNSSDQVCSVGDDGHSVRHWTISTYGEYAKLFRSLDDVFATGTVTQWNEAECPDVRRPGHRTVSRTQKRVHRAIPVSTHALAAAVQQPRQPFRIGSSDGSPNFIAAYSARFSRDGNRIVVGANDRAAHVYDTAGRKTGTMAMGGRGSLFFDPDKNVFLEGHIPNLQSLRVLPPDGRRLLTSDWSGSISVWDSKDDEDGIGREVSRLLPENSQSEIAVSDDGKLVLAAGVRETPDSATGTSSTAHVALLWKLDTIESSPTPRPDVEFIGEHPEDEITAVAISPSGERIVTAGRRGRMVVWNAGDSSVIARAQGTHNKDGVSGIAFIAEDELISAGYDGHVRRWKISGEEIRQSEQTFERRKVEDEPDNDDFVLSLRMAPDRRRFATTALKQISGGESGKETYLFRVTIWSTFSDLPVKELRSTTIAANERGRAFEQGVSWSPDGTRLLFVSNQKETATTAATEIYVYDADSWKVLNRLRQSVADPNQTLSERDRVQFNAPAIQAAFVPGENPPKRIATFDGRAAHLWDLESGRHLAEFRAHAAVLGVSFSFDRKYLATASESLRVFDADEESPNHAGTVFRILNPHMGRIDGVAFSPAKDDYRIASVGAVGDIRLWNWKPHTPPPSEAAITIPPVTLNADADKTEHDAYGGNSVAISPDGSHLLGVQRGHLGLWKISGNEAQSVPIVPDIDGHVVFNTVAFSSDGSRFAAGGIVIDEDGDVTSVAIIFQYETGGPETSRTVAVLQGGHTVGRGGDDQIQGVSAIAFGPASETLLTGGADGRVFEWIYTDPGSGAEPYRGSSSIELRIANRAPHSRPVDSLDVSVNGDIVTSGEDGFIAVWPH